MKRVSPSVQAEWYIMAHMLVRDELTQAEIERILHSDTFRNSEVLRRLLRFLGEKSISGEADQLKEYTIGIDALGKPSSYDPRQDSGVRIQIGRLRQKLAEYYRLEGKDDPVVIDLPKGRFKLSCEPASRPTESPLQLEAVPHDEKKTMSPALTAALTWRRATILLATLLVFISAWGIYSAVRLSSENRFSATFRSVWTPELSELWKPFLVPDRPLILAVATPLFVGFQGAGLFRDPSINNWEDAQKSPRIEGLRKALKSPAIVPRYYTAVGEMSAVFRLGKILTASPVNVSVSRSTQISQQQLADSNVIFVGAPRVYGDRLGGLPVQPEFVMDEKGVRNLHPRSGEPASLEDHYPGIFALETSVPDNGEVYALVTHAPGPLGSGDIEIFSANHNPGTLAAVEWFTQPNLAKIVVSRLRKANGEIPRYFQIVLDVTYKDAVPTEVSYVMHRELQPAMLSNSK
jgi:hypothetical protein